MRKIYLGRFEQARTIFNLFICFFYFANAFVSMNMLVEQINKKEENFTPFDVWTENVHFIQPAHYKWFASKSCQCSPHTFAYINQKSFQRKTNFTFACLFLATSSNQNRENKYNKWTEYVFHTKYTKIYKIHTKSY